ncbi:unnamed protein product [Dibothriocephalus latus]|uniref:NADP-dependent oxidoreductase domain-containing protein n=1 Tax=Dibothriocephalus latus TaxID=60516 RepID=A0A3P7MZB1_DIBLA|nr:unnamed protein product [Dibothriocephalus latus]
MAINAGYRHIDCAFSHGNEFAVGVALKNQIVTEGFPRRKLFVTSKLWCTFHKKLLVRENCIRSLRALNLEYLDLYMINWPVSLKSGVRQPNGEPEYDSVPIEETWEAMEQLVQMGLVRSIGLSNFNEDQIRRVLGCCSIPPAVLQVESHPYFLNNELISFAQGIGMKVTACAPLGSSYTEP